MASPHTQLFSKYPRPVGIDFVGDRPTDNYTVPRIGTHFTGIDAFFPGSEGLGSALSFSHMYGTWPLVSKL